MNKAQATAAGIAGAAGMIAAVTLASRVVGFFRWLVQSWTLGSTPTADAYAKANTLPNVLFEITAGGALAGMIVPLLAAPLAAGLVRDTARRASVMLTLTLTILIPAAVVVMVAAPWLATMLLGADAQAESHQLTTYFLRVFAIQIPLYGVGTVLSGILQAHHRFFWPAMAPLISSLVMIVTYLAAWWFADGQEADPATLPDSAAAWLAWGTTAGVLAMTACQLPQALRLGLRFRPAWRLDPKVRRQAAALAGAGLTTLLAQQITVLVILRVTAAQPGSYNVWQYAQAVTYLPYAVLAVPLATAIFPRISVAAARHLDGPAENTDRTDNTTGKQHDSDRNALDLLVSVSTRAVSAVSIIGAAVLIAVAPAVTHLFSLRFDMPGMTETITVMALGLPGFALLFHLTRVLYALRRAKNAIIGAVAGWGIVALGAAGAAVMLPVDRLLVGVAAAWAIGLTVAGVILGIAVRYSTGSGGLAGLPKTLTIAVPAAAVGAVVGRIIMASIGGADLWLVIVGAVAAALAAALPGCGLLWVADRKIITSLLHRPSQETPTDTEDTA